MYKLDEYFQFFEKAEYTMIDVSVKFTDPWVEYILQDVERKNGIRFKPDVRVLLWKAFRHIWARGGCRGAADFIREEDVPKLFLPKKDYRAIDYMIRLADMDPDRQRQIVRKYKPIPSTGRGPGVQTLQFELYRRQDDLWYEFKDLQRCVVEWQKKNPRMLLQEDPREEVMKLRIQGIIEQAVELHETVLEKDNAQWRLWLFLFFMQSLMAVLSGFMLFVAYVAYAGSPDILKLTFIGGSKQLISAVAFFQAFAVAYVVNQRRQTNPMIKRYRHACVSAERLMEQISDFRIETNDLRIAPRDKQREVKEDVPKRKLMASLTDGLAGRLGPKSKLAGEETRKKKKKKKRGGDDKALGMWLENAALEETAFADQAVMNQHIQASYKQLPPPEVPIRRPGGNRMVQFESRLGGANEEELCVVAQKARNEEAIPLNGPPRILPRGMSKISDASGGELSTATRRGGMR